MSNAQKKMEKRTWLNVDILYEDEFYARTPDTDKTFPPTVKATYTIVGQNTTRSTLEELPLDPLPETEKKQEDTTNPSVDKTFENEELKIMKKLLKKILQWISQNPQKYKFVFVLWEDANSDSSWNELSTIEQMLPTICISVGF